MNTQKCSFIDLVADELIEVVNSFAEHLKLLDEETVQHRPSEDRWTIQEVIGHLIDSAANNHHRFVRAQQVDALRFPDYQQNFWVNAQFYNEGSWHELVELWRLYNLHLAHVIRRVPDRHMRVECSILPNEPVSLSFLIEDYLTHLKHHITKINERLSL